jgi:hypothetical protein
MTAPGVNVSVTTEVGYCPFCQRTRNLRREERHLGGLVRTIVTCESCNRTLFSQMGVPSAKPAEEPAAPVVEATAPEPALESKPAPEPKPARAPAAAKARRPAATRAKATAAPAARKPAAKKPAAKKK